MNYEALNNSTKIEKTYLFHKSINYLMVVIRIYGLSVWVYGLVNQNPITEPKLMGSCRLGWIRPVPYRVRVNFGLDWFGLPGPRVYPHPCTPLIIVLKFQHLTRL